MITSVGPFYALDLSIIALCLFLATPNAVCASEAIAADGGAASVFITRQAAETLISQKAPEMLTVWQSAIDGAAFTNVAAERELEERLFRRPAIERLIELHHSPLTKITTGQDEAGGIADSPGRSVLTALKMADADLTSKPTDEEKRLLHLAALAANKYRAIAIMVDRKNTSTCGTEAQNTCINTISLIDHLAAKAEKICADVKDRRFELVPKEKRNICTAFRIGDDYIATAKHCIGKTTAKLWSVMDDYVFVFGFTGDAREFSESSIIRGTEIQSAIYSDKQDWILFDISPIAHRLTADTVSLPSESVSLNDRSRFYQIGHPLGRELFIDDGPLLSYDSDHIYYVADSYSGFSGAPVFNSDELAGIFVGGPAVLDLYQDPQKGCTRPFICCREQTDEGCVNHIKLLQGNAGARNKLAESQLQCLNGARAIRSTQFESCLRNQRSCESLIRSRAVVGAVDGH